MTTKLQSRWIRGALGAAMIVALAVATLVVCSQVYEGPIIHDIVDFPPAP